MYIDKTRNWLAFTKYITRTERVVCNVICLFSQFVEIVYLFVYFSGKRMYIVKTRNWLAFTKSVTRTEKAPTAG